MDQLKGFLPPSVANHADVILAIAIVLITTRLFTAISLSSGTKPTRPAVAPYWLFYLGHFPRVYMHAGWALTRLRDRFRDGLFSINLLGNTHTVIHRPSLAASLLEQPASVADDKPFARHLMVTNFGLPKRDLAAYDKAAAELQTKTNEFFAGDALEKVTKRMIGELNGSAGDFVSYNSYPTDQSEWERLAQADPVEGNDAVEEPTMQADLMMIVKAFVSKTSNVCIFGSNLIENVPEIWHLIWDVDSGFSTMALGITQWLPVPNAQRSRAALRKLLNFLTEYNEAWDKQMRDEDPGARWPDLHDASDLVKARVEIYRKHGLSMRARAACDVALIWSLNARAAPLVMWCLFELYQDPVLLADLRQEIAPHVKVVQPRNEFGLAVWVPPEISHFDLDGLLTKCPTLKAVYAETQRRYGGGWTARWLKDNVELKEDGKAAFVLDKGTYAHVLRGLHNSDPKAFAQPREWSPSRYLSDEQDTKAQSSATWEFGENPMAIGDADFVLRKTILYIVTILSLHDIKPANGKRWPGPFDAKSPTTSRPRQAVRVWITSKKVPAVK